MQISNVGLNLIKVDEGFEPRLYNCPAGDATDTPRPLGTDLRRGV
jgi:GH24 family phage-related lysozyme (muramidase)